MHQAIPNYYSRNNTIHLSVGYRSEGEKAKCLLSVATDLREKKPSVCSQLL
jgi:hypothetical protein